MKRDDLMPLVEIKNLDRTLQQIAMMRAHRFTHADIMDVTGLSYSALRKNIGEMIAVGIIPRRPRQKASVITYDRLKRADVRMGHVMSVYLGLTEPQRAWLIRQSPEGGTLADALTLIVRDAYFDDTGEQNDY